MVLICCGECGKQVSNLAAVCPNCGAPVAGHLLPVATPVIITATPKSRLVAAVLAMLLGVFGVHWFYLNNRYLGAFYLLFSWTLIPAIAGVCDGLFFIVMSDEAFQRKHVG
jgi:TM2 domain-containing membrane protein YozV